MIRTFVYRIKIISTSLDGKVDQLTGKIDKFAKLLSDCTKRGAVDSDEEDEKPAKKKKKKPTKKHSSEDES